MCLCNPVVVSGHDVEVWVQYLCVFFFLFFLFFFCFFFVFFFCFFFLSLSLSTMFLFCIIILPTIIMIIISPNYHYQYNMCLPLTTGVSVVLLPSYTQLSMLQTAFVGMCVAPVLFPAMVTFNLFIPCRFTSPGYTAHPSIVTWHWVIWSFPTKPQSKWVSPTAPTIICSPSILSGTSCPLA